MATVPISTLAANVQSRLEESVGSPGAWWSLLYEINSALVEAMNDLMLLVGRPTQEVNVPFTLTPNTVWQTIPKGLFQVTDIQGAGELLYKINLYDLDYLQTYWTSDWQQDVANTASEWAPLGFNMFIVHPAVNVAQTITLTGIQYPVQVQWPYDGTQTVPFEDQFFQHLEEYAAFYCRIKEMGGEFQAGLKLFDQYLAGARRMSQIQDRRDPVIFTSGFGGMQRTNPTTKR